MFGDHAKREIMTDKKPASSGRTLSRESDKSIRRNRLPPSSRIERVTRKRRK
jgi:hypothetical protein